MCEVFGVKRESWGGSGVRVYRGKSLPTCKRKISEDGQTATLGETEGNRIINEVQIFLQRRGKSLQRQTTGEGGRALRRVYP